MSNIRKLAGETAIYGISTVLGRFLNFLLVPFYTWVFMPNEYGVVTELYAYITFLLVIYTYGMETAFFRFSSADKSPSKAFSVSFYSLLFSSLIFSTLLWTASDSIARGIGYEDQSHLFRWTALILLFDTIAVIPFALLRFQQKASRFTKLKVGQILLNISFNLWFLLACPYLIAIPEASAWISYVYDPAIGPGYVFISNALASMLILPFFLKEYGLLRLYFDFRRWKAMVVFSMPLVVVGMAGMINEVSDRMMLRHLLPYEADMRMYYLGIYGACYKLSIFMTLGVQAFRYAAEPFFFREAKENEAPETYAAVMHYFVAAGSLVFLGISLFLDLIKLIINASYHEGIHIVPILLMANLFLGMYYNTAIWYKLTDKTGTGAIIAGIGALITIGGNLLLIPTVGYTGAAITTLLCYASMTLISWRWGRKYYFIPYRPGLIAFLLFSALAIYLIAEWFLWQVPMHFLPEYILRLAALAAYLWIVKTLFYPGKKLKDLWSGK